MLGANIGIAPYLSAVPRTRSTCRLHPLRVRVRLIPRQALALALREVGHLELRVGPQALEALLAGLHSELLGTQMLMIVLPGAHRALLHLQGTVKAGAHRIRGPSARSSAARPSCCSRSALYVR